MPSILGYIILKNTEFKSNLLEAISKLIPKTAKITSILAVYLSAYRHMKLHSKQPVKQAALNFSHYFKCWHERT